MTDGPTGNGSTISGANSAQLTFNNVKVADAGAYSVTVSNLAGATPGGSASLSVGEIPVVSLIDNSTNVLGADHTIAATVTSGSTPMTFAWSHNNAVITDDGHFTITDGTLGIHTLVDSDARLYSLSVSNKYGGVTVPSWLWVIISTNRPNDVPDLIVYEPFDYPPGPNPAVGYYSWENLISIYNRVTGEPAYWINTGNGLYTAVGAWPTDLYQGTARNGGGLPEGTAGGRYPYPGLDCAARNRWAFSSSGCNNHLHFGGVTNGAIYFSFIFTGDQGSAVANGTFDVVAGFTSGNSDRSGVNANNFAYALCTKADDAPGESNAGMATDGDGGWRFGVFKGGGINISSVSANGQWAPLHCWRAHPYLIVGCYKIVSGGTTTNDDIVSLWVEPPIATFGADEDHVPTPDAGGMMTNWNANAPITEFSIRATLNTSPFSKAISDLRIGKTWASVTKPYYPVLQVSKDPSSVTMRWPAKDSFADYGYRFSASGDLLNWVLNPPGFTVGTDGQLITVTTNNPVADQFWMLIYPARTRTYHTY